MDLFKTAIDINNLTDEMRNYLYGDVDLFNSKTNKEFVTKTLAALNQGQMLSIVDKNPAEPKFKMINYSVKSPKG